MAVKRIKPNVLSDRFEESRAFYREVIGLEEGEGLDWILFFGTEKREVQLGRGPEVMPIRRRRSDCRRQIKRASTKSPRERERPTQPLKRKTG
jgi:catechol 2,3-dioxygenase-like lactoylglutathione lyase family enzyme